LFYTEIFQNISAKFIYYRFLLIDWYSFNEASGVPSLNAKTIENIEISTPHYVEQTRIATILSDMDAELSALEQKLEKYKKVKLGMMQELLTGKTRLN
jgi:type I restriction enzyme S subunit